MKKKIQVIDADYRIEDGEVTVRCFGKSVEGENVLFLDEDFLPYLYAVPEEDIKLDELEQEIVESKFEEEGEEIPVRKVERKNLKDGNKEKEVLKVYSSIPAKIPKLKNQLWDIEGISECREFDIPFYKRYLIDNKVKPAEWIEIEGEELESEELDFKLKLESLNTEIQVEKDQERETLAFDLEVYQDRIIMASVYSDKFRKVFTTEEIERDFVETVESEREIILKLIDIIRERDVDILLGYNTDEYDFDVLRERSDEYGIKLAMGRDGERMKFNRRGRFSGARLKGRMHLDLYPFISHVLSPGLESETLDLDSVAEEMLDENKDDLSWEEMKASWRDKEDLDVFADYALKDSKLTYKLGKEIGPQILELSRITGLIPFDACRLTYGQLTENYLIREAYERDILSRNRPSRDKRRNRRRQGAYSGGFVYTPEPGLYENIAVFDFKSLPPDEEVYLKDPEGCFVKEKIGELEQKIQNPLDWETLSFNTETMQVEWKRLRKVVSHQNNFEYLYSFETETGKSIKLTPNHSVYTLNEEGTPCVRDANELETGDNLIAPKKFPVEETSSLDLLRLLKRSEAQNKRIRLFLPREIFPENERIEAWKQILRCVCEGKSLEEVRQKVERHPETVMRNIRRMDEKDLVEYKEGRISVKESGRKYFKLLKNLQQSEFNGSYYLYSSIEKIDSEWLTDEMWEKGTLKKENAYWSRKMPLKWNPSKEMCWCMGLFIAEGWTDRKYARAHFSNTDEEILHKLEHLLEEFDPEIVEDEGDQEIRIGGGIFARTFSTLFGRTSEQKKISEEIFNLSRSQKKGLIEGMVAGDGSVSEKSFKYTTCSRELATDLQNILLSIGIYKTALRKSRENLYDLRVLTKPGEWKSYSGEREQHPLDLVPREYAEESLNQELKWGHRGPRIDSEKVFSNLKEKTPKLAFFEGDTGLEKIEKKEKIESDAKLYDLSVQGNQNFFAGEMPLLVHNSLYPTVMVAHNISPDTLNLEECEDRFELEEFDYDFCQDYQGFFPELVEELVEDRSRLKQKMSELEKESSEYQNLDNRQQAEKILANSFYGYLGYNGARWYSRECAEATTYLGREYIQDTIELAEDEGFEIAYGDTDSVFMKGDNIREEMDSFLEKVNDDLPEFMKLEFEGFFERGFFTSTDSGEGAKKKYALINEEGGMKITGFEQVRRDWSPIAKRTQKEVLREVLENDVDEAVEIAKNTIEELREGEVPVEELRIYTTLNKKPENYDSTAPHVEAAKKAIKDGIDISPGSTIAYVITRGGGSISQRARILEQADSYDADYYIENQVLPAVMRVLKVFGYTEGQLKGKGKQSGLGKFG